MHKKKLVAALAVAGIVSSGAFLAFHVHQAKTAQPEPVRPAGVINPDRSAAGMKIQAQPQLSTQRFKPPPPISTGTYTDPDYRKDSKQQDASKKKNDSAR